MKIKGAFTVRWAAQNGSDGKGVTIVKTEIKYAVSTSGTTKPSGVWQTNIPSVSDGNYLWTWTHVEYSDGTKTDAYSVSRHGIDGKGIKSSTTDYKQMENTNIAPENITGWGGFPTNLTDGWWLYTRQTVTYSDGATAVSYSVVQIGQGAYYAGLSEYYCASDSPSVPPSNYPKKEKKPGVFYTESEYPLLFVNGETIQIGDNWKSTRSEVTLNSKTPYLWNFEISRDSKGNQYVTFPSLIANFAKGIVSIVETYAISAQNSVPSNRDYPIDIKESEWTDEAHAVAPTDAKRYQWNKTTTTYNDGSVQNNYHISAVKGIDGKGAVYIDIDNENDSMLYDGSGNRVSGDMVSNIKLYDNGVDVTSDGTFSIDSSSGVYNPSISVSTLTVTTMTADSGHVIVKCIYKGVTYYARFTCKKIIGTDKYEIVCTPSALTFNEDTDTGGQVTVTIQVYKTAQNGVRTLLQSLPAGYSIVIKWDDNHTTSMKYIDCKATFKPNDSKYSRYRIELLDASKNVLDYETIPINHVKNGADATLYELIPFADKITRKHDGTLSPETINCKSYKKTGTDYPELVTSGAQMSYDYYEGTVKHTVNNYTGDNITPTPWWTKIVFYLKSSDGVVLTQREILVENESISPELNLLNDTNFANLDLDSSTNSDVFVGEGVDGSNALFCNPSSLEKDAVPYTEVWEQAVSQPNDKRLLPSTWYTLSFYAKSLGWSQINIKQRSNLYGFATRSVYLTKATHTLRIRGNVSTLALQGDRDLRVFVYKDDWSWYINVSINQSSITEAEVSFTPPSEGTYKITAYCYVEGGGNGAAEQTVYLEWYRLKLTNRHDILHSYCYPSVIDTQQVQVHDGNVADSRHPDGYNAVSLSLSWKRFYMVFKTKSTIPTDINKVLFRIPKDGNSVYLSQMKLERGVFPTAWNGSNNDAKGYSGAKPYFLKYSEIKNKEIDVYQGVGDEEWYTIVYDDVENTGWYTPKYTHTTTNGEVLTDTAKWLKSNMNFVATSVFFAQMAYIENLGVRNVLLSNGKEIEGGMCYSDDNGNGNGGSLGLGEVRLWLGGSNPQKAPNRQYKDGSVVFSNGNARFDSDGNASINNLTATNGSFEGEVKATSGTFNNGTFTNVKINGSMRCTFQQPNAVSFSKDANDNVSLLVPEGPLQYNYELPSDAGQSGRRITIVNWKWSNYTYTKPAIVTSGLTEGFYENGITKSSLTIGREVVELLGYGTEEVFYGWIVLRRVNLP